VCAHLPYLGLKRGQCDTRPMVIFPAARHRCLTTGTKLYCLVTEAHVCELLAQGRYLTMEWYTSWTLQANALTILSPGHTRRYSDIYAHMFGTLVPIRSMAAATKKTLYNIPDHDECFYPIGFFALWKSWITRSTSLLTFMFAPSTANVLLLHNHIICIYRYQDC